MEFVEWVVREEGQAIASSVGAMLAVVLSVIAVTFYPRQIVRLVRGKGRS